VNSRIKIRECIARFAAPAWLDSESPHSPRVSIDAFREGCATAASQAGTHISTSCTGFEKMRKKFNIYAQAH
jgi:hypothetical protein